MPTRVPARQREKNIVDRVRDLESTTNIRRRMETLERRVEAGLQQRDSYKQTNTLLAQVLLELRKINDQLEQESGTLPANTDVKHTTVHRPHDSRSGSPNQDFIIVEAYADQL